MERKRGDGGSVQGCGEERSLDVESMLGWIMAADDDER